jgi:excisionase family DNA binding protein
MTDTKPIGTPEAAARLNVSRPTLTRMAQSGKITPLHKANGQRGAYVFDESEVERVAQERQR